MPEADRQPDDYNVWAECECEWNAHEWQWGKTYASRQCELTCAKCGAVDYKDVS